MTNPKQRVREREGMSKLIKPESIPQVNDENVKTAKN